jgi:hypothetical protein
MSIEILILNHQVHSLVAILLAQVSGTPPAPCLIQDQHKSCHLCTAAMTMKISISWTTLGKDLISYVKPTIPSGEDSASKGWLKLRISTLARQHSFEVSSI